MTVSDEDQLAEAFEAERDRLRSVAYRMLGSAYEADDAVQEAWLRLQRTDGIDNLGGWLTTVVSRVCLDMLRSRSSRREDAYAEVERPPSSRRGAGHPEFEAELADSVGSAMLVVLQTLAPAERLAFVLHDMFAVPFERHRHDRRPLPRGHPSAREPWSTPGAAARRGDRHRRPRGRRRVPAGLARPATSRGCCRCWTPTPSYAPTQPPRGWAPRSWSSGARTIAETYDGRAVGLRPAVVDGAPGAAWVHAKDIKVAFAFTVVDGLITEIELLADPERHHPARVEMVRRSPPPSPQLVTRCSGR